MNFDSTIGTQLENSKSFKEHEFKRIYYFIYFSAFLVVLAAERTIDNNYLSGNLLFFLSSLTFFLLCFFVWNIGESLDALINGLQIEQSRYQYYLMKKNRRIYTDEEFRDAFPHRWITKFLSDEALWALVGGVRDQIIEINKLYFLCRIIFWISITLGWLFAFIGVYFSFIEKKEINFCIGFFILILSVIICFTAAIICAYKFDKKNKAFHSRSASNSLSF